MGVAKAGLALHGALSPIITALGDAGNGTRGLVNALAAVFVPLGATSDSLVAATKALQSIWTALQRVGAILIGEFTGSVSGAQGALAGVVNFLLGSVLPALAVAATWFADNLPAAIATAKAVFGDIGAFISSLMPTIQSIISTALAIIATYWQQNGQTILTLRARGLRDYQGRDSDRAGGHSGHSRRRAGRDDRRLGYGARRDPRRQHHDLERDQPVPDWHLADHRFVLRHDAG
jgi:hypothetical protein